LKEEVTGELKTLHNEELHDLYSSPSGDQIRKNLCGACSTHRANNKRQ